LPLQSFQVQQGSLSFLRRYTKVSFLKFRKSADLTPDFFLLLQVPNLSGLFFFFFAFSNSNRCAKASDCSLFFSPGGFRTDFGFCLRRLVPVPERPLLAAPLKRLMRSFPFSVPVGTSFPYLPPPLFFCLPPFALDQTLITQNALPDLFLPPPPWCG